MLIHPYYVRAFLCIPEVFRTYPFHSVSQLYIPYTFHIRQLRLHDNCSFISVKRVLGTEKAVNLKDQLLIPKPYSFFIVIKFSLPVHLYHVRHT